MFQGKYSWDLSECPLILKRATIVVFVFLFAFGDGRRGSAAVDPPKTVTSEAVSLAQSIRSDTERLISVAVKASNAGDTATHSTRKKTMLEIAKRRQAVMMSLMEKAPAEALKQAFPATWRDWLPAEVRDHVEARVSLEGILEVLGWVAEDGRAGYEYYLDLGETRLKLFVENPPDTCVNGTRVTVDGLRLADQLAANNAGVTVLEPAPSASDAKPKSGVRYERGLVINVNFPSIPTEPWTIEQAINVFTNEVMPYFVGASYDQYMIDFQIAGWYTIDAPTDTCESRTYRELGVAAAEASGIDTSPYDHVVIAFPRVPACRWAGLGQVPGRYTWLNNAMRATTATHELGHNLGLAHSHSIRCSDGPLDGNCSRAEYGDHFDRMGSGPLVSYHGTYKVYLGWIPTSDMVDVTAEDGDKVVTIYSVEQASGPRVVRAFRPGTDEFFTMEMREPIDVDEPLSRYPYLLTGVAVYMGSSLRNQSIIDVAYETSTVDDAPLQVGDTLYDPISTLSITTVAVGNGQATIYVSYNP